MNEDNTQPDSTDQSEQEQRPARGGRLALILSLLTLGSLGAVLWFGYPHWQAMRQDMLSMQRGIQDSLQIQAELKTSLENAHQLIQQSPTTSQLSEHRMALDAQQQLLGKARTAMEQRELALRITIAELRKRSGKPDNRWMVAEAEYLLQLARARLQLAGDTDTAITAIRQARQRLLETGDDQWADIRQLLAVDADKLAAIKRPDPKQLSADISNLVDQVPELQPAYRNLITRDAKDESTTDSNSTEAPPRSWQTLLQALTSNARDAVRIRRHDRMPMSPLGPEQERLLYQSLELILETSRLALLQRDMDLFRDNLQRATHWIRNRFEPKQATAADMLSKLDQLMQINLAPELPDISPTLQALQARKALLDSQSTEVSGLQ